MKLVIAEKPSVAMSIAKVLGAKNREDGYMRGKGYLISWCIGHLVGFVNPEHYDEKYEKWDLKDLPIIPKNWELEILKKTGKQFKIIEKLMKSEEVTTVINACDAGREGELIFRLVYDKAKCKKPMERLWISSMEESAIEEGFLTLKDGKNYDKLYESAKARAQADWLVGINGTRLFSTLYHTTLSVGRVQTPTLAMVVKREHEIENFKSKEFYHVLLHLNGFDILSKAFDKREEAEEILKNITEDKITCSGVTKKEKQSKPPLPYDLTTLQREANRYFGYTAKQTLDYAQELYEKKWITYPRTDSRYLTKDMEKLARNLLERIDIDVDLKDPKIHRIINNEKVSDHHAILPTIHSTTMDINDLSSTHEKLYGLICMRFLASVMDECIESKTKASFHINGNEFTVSGVEVLQEGYRSLEKAFIQSIKEKKPKEENKKPLPNIAEGEQFSIQGKDIKIGKTSPPKRFTEDLLLSAMERAGTKDLEQELETEKEGLGTPATRASTIEKLISMGYMVRKKKQFVPTHKAYNLIAVVPEELKSATLTAEWENMLAEITHGYMNVEVFMNGIEDYVREIIATYDHVIHDNPFIVKKDRLGDCPRCKDSIYEAKNTFYCVNKDCEFVLFKKDRFFTNKKKTLSKEMVKELLSKGEVAVKGLYSEKKQKTYDAIVTMEDTGKYINYKLKFKK